VRTRRLFAGSYLAVWTLVGVAVYTLYWPHTSFAAGEIPIAAGVYEFMPLKGYCGRYVCPLDSRAKSIFVQ
jgi:predicted metal-binding membrane protein